jgi:hypothetical protein
MQINFGGFNFNPFGNNTNETCIIEVQLGNAVVEKQEMPLVFAKEQMTQAIHNMARDSRPMQIKCIRYDYTEEDKKLENSLAFQNNAFIKNFGKEEVST